VQYVEIDDIGWAQRQIAQAKKQNLILEAMSVVTLKADMRRTGRDVR